jgi:hypothetical protein
MTSRNLLLALLLVTTGASAQVGTPPTVQQAEAMERARIRDTRAAAQARFDAQEAQCYQRFAVNDCLADARLARRELLADLRRQELSLNDAQRKRRAAEQLLRSDDKAITRPP